MLFERRYHHLSVLISVFYCFSNFTPYVRWFMVMNYMVHSVMYSYYTLKALRSSHPPKHAIHVLIFWRQDPSATGHCCNHNEPSDCPDACQHCHQLSRIQEFLNFDFHYFLALPGFSHQPDLTILCEIILKSCPVETMLLELLWQLVNSTFWSYKRPTPFNHLIPVHTYVIRNTYASIASFWPRYLRSREGCPVDAGNLAFTSFVVLSYLALFLKYFSSS